MQLTHTHTQASACVCVTIERKTHKAIRSEESAVQSCSTHIALKSCSRAASSQLKTLTACIIRRKKGKRISMGEEWKTTEPTKFLNFLVNTRDSTPLSHMQIMFIQMEKYSLYVLKEWKLTHVLLRKKKVIALDLRQNACNFLCALF